MLMVAGRQPIPLGAPGRRGRSAYTQSVATLHHHLDPELVFRTCAGEHLAASEMLRTLPVPLPLPGVKSAYATLQRWRALAEVLAQLETEGRATSTLTGRRPDQCRRLYTLARPGEPAGLLRGRHLRHLAAHRPAAYLEERALAAGLDERLEPRARDAIFLAQADGPLHREHYPGGLPDLHRHLPAGRVDPFIAYADALVRLALHYRDRLTAGCRSELRAELAARRLPCHPDPAELDGRRLQVERRRQELRRHRTKAGAPHPDRLPALRGHLWMDLRQSGPTTPVWLLTSGYDPLIRNARRLLAAAVIPSDERDDLEPCVVAGRPDLCCAELEGAALLTAGHLLRFHLSDRDTLDGLPNLEPQTTPEAGGLRPLGALGTVDRVNRQGTVWWVLWGAGEAAAGWEWTPGAGLRGLLGAARHTDRWGRLRTAEDLLCPAGDAHALTTGIAQLAEFALSQRLTGI